MDGGSALQQLLDPPKSWTFDDLQQLLEELQELPDDVDWRRFEIVDGALVVSPAAGRRHEYVAALLRLALADQLSSDLLAVGPLGIDLVPSYRVPDVLVVSRRSLLAGAPLMRPAEVLLAVEIVSPSSRTTDRVTKPAQYAAAGIAGYWRVETDPELSLTAYALDEGDQLYAELGTWRPGQVADIERPFRASIAVDRLVPDA